MKFYGVIQICDHLYFIMKEAGKETDAHDIMSCLEMPGYDLSPKYDFC